jgi:phosphate transport system substrate-binding protein
VVATRSRTLAAMAALTLVSVLAAGCTGSASQSPAARSGRAPGSSSGVGNIPSNPGHIRLTLSETGSTLLYPLFQAWAPAYHQAFPGITITTAGTGSGVGIADASEGTADIGASDAILSSGNLVQDPGLLNIPLAISAQQVNYNVPELKPGTHIRLNGAVLAQIYSGVITSWRNSAIQALNPGLSLPALKIVPLHRMDSSGDTFLFTSYLSTDDPAWNSRIGYGTTVAWPHVPGAKQETGNSGMVSGCAATPGCIAYIGISYLTTALQDHLGEAELQNTAGRFLLPDGPSMLAAVSSFVPATPTNETISMVNGPAPDGYPIVNYEYAIVSRDQPSPAKSRALKAFLHWAITTGNTAQFLDQVRFEQLPPEVVKLADAQIAGIR